MRSVLFVLAPFALVVFVVLLMRGVVQRRDNMREFAIWWLSVIWLVLTVLAWRF